RSVSMTLCRPITPFVKSGGTMQERLSRSCVGTDPFRHGCVQAGWKLKAGLKTIAQAVVRVLESQWSERTLE
ncbi:MAG: hypothetical protein IKA98_01855, partial [Candidatus Methanomethylophilaceae archaeon]|nr:hypothetical protein [Candidatus Methanomethylophilaceae archaeon]